VLLESLKP